MTFCIPTELGTFRIALHGSSVVFTARLTENRHTRGPKRVEWQLMLGRLMRMPKIAYLTSAGPTKMPPLLMIFSGATLFHVP